MKKLIIIGILITSLLVNGCELLEKEVELENTCGELGAINLFGLGAEEAVKLDCTRACGKEGLRYKGEYTCSPEDKIVCICLKR